MLQALRPVIGGSTEQRYLNRDNPKLSLYQDLTALLECIEFPFDSLNSNSAPIPAPAVLRVGRGREGGRHAVERRERQGDHGHVAPAEELPAAHRQQGRRTMERRSCWVIVGQVVYMANADLLCGVTVLHPGPSEYSKPNIMTSF